MIRYTVYFNGEQVKSYDIDEPVIFIGRLPENHIPIFNMGISRRHVKIELDAYGSYTLTDLNSLNGTHINGKKVKKATLVNGDKIAIGKYTIVYEDMRSDAAAHLETIVAELRPEELRAAGAQAPLQMIPPRADVSANDEAFTGAVLIETTGHVVYRLDRDYLTIGSDETDDIYAAGFMVNKGFAVIEQRDGGFYISAQKMIAKIKINGKSVRVHRLEHRDRIEIGSNTFRFMENG
jgi:pSer/pThr/pTyr-binding forkhead associated (FHA) protein